MSGPGSQRDPTVAAGEPRDTSDLPAQYRTAIVGVLPFVNLSDSADEYFSDGLTEDLIHALSLQSFFRVLSRNATFSFKGKNLSTRLIAREIDATYLIQGSVRRAGTKIRVTAELIAPEKGEQLWTGRYDRDIGDLFAMQDEITTSLCAALAPEIYRAEASAPARPSSTDLTAWDRFLRGLSHYYRQTKTDLEASIALFREAIALDPALSIACAYLATILIARRALWMDPKHPRIVGRGNEPCGKQCQARSPFVIRIFNSVLCARDGGALRGSARCRKTGGRAEPVRHGRPRRAWHLSLSLSGSIDRPSNYSQRPCSAAIVTPDFNGPP